MIFIVVKFRVLPSQEESWLQRVSDFTHGTRQEEGNLWFDWFRSTDHDDEYVLVEAFRDADAGAVHVQSAHFVAGLETMREALSETPRIINVEVPGSDWNLMGELEIATATT